MPENNKKIVLELNKPLWNNNQTDIESINSNIFFNEQIIFSDIYFQATDKETKNRSIKKEKNIYFNYEQKNIIKFNVTHSIGNNNLSEFYSFSIENNNSSPNNLYDVNYSRNCINIVEFVSKYPYFSKQNVYINDILLDEYHDILKTNVNIFKQINLSKNDTIIISNSMGIDSMSSDNPNFSIKIENI
jgi:hypothetical protein